jgi:hypothetical protein
MGDQDVTKEDLPKKEEEPNSEHRNRGVFVGAAVATFISLASSSGVSFGMVSSQKDDNQEAAAQVAEQTATEKATKVETQVADHLNEKVVPEIELMKEAIEELSDGLEECFDAVEQVDRQAYAALLMLEMQRGGRAVARTLERVEDEKESEPETARAKKRKEHARKIKTVTRKETDRYEQRIVE